MAHVAAYEDVKVTRAGRDLPGGHMAWRTDFMRPGKDDPDGPVAFLAESTPKRVLRSHFHECDQFQIIALGGGTLAKHTLAFGGIHFSRAFTPYGPITNGEQGIGFITLRNKRDPGGKAQFVPDYSEKLKSVKARDPWQVTEMPTFKALSAGENSTCVQFKEMQDERGLAGYAVTVRANTKVAAPAPSKDGQYLIVTKGSLFDKGVEKKGLSVIWVGGDEKPFELQAGAEGLEVVALNFPRESNEPAKAPKAKADNSEFKSYQCVLCAVVYDEAEGMPEHGIAAGTRWADVPEDFGCPDCDAKKADFELIEF
jgi:rubredoxin